MCAMCCSQVKQLRHAALDAFWASAPLFMIAMGLTVASRYSYENGPSMHGLAVAVVFGGTALPPDIEHATRSRSCLSELGRFDGWILISLCGLYRTIQLYIPLSLSPQTDCTEGAGGGVLLVCTILAVLYAHRSELHYHYHPEDRPLELHKRGTRYSRSNGSESPDTFSVSCHSPCQNLIRMVLPQHSTALIRLLSICYGGGGIGPAWRAG
jgi:hypothetical protein